MRHYRKTLKTYAKLRAKDERTMGCSYCSDYANGTFKLIAEGGTMLTVYNRVPYDMFEGQRVTDNIMVIPKRHVETLADFSDEEKLEHMTIVGNYERQGYDVYARGVGSITRSMTHQHTHLIKMENIKKQPNFLLFIRKPYILIDK
jgi:galactose-1-phosphate uridylyltransferase